MPKFTPGPWQFDTDRFNDDEGLVYCVEDVARTNIILAKIPIEDSEATAALANANLIAAAPEMYEMIEALLEVYEIAIGNDDLTHEAQALIDRIVS